MIDPGLISAGVGFISSIFGGGPKTPGYVQRNYDLINSIMNRGIDLYDSTDLASQDADTVNAYSKGSMDRALKMATNYDAKAAAMGSPLWKGDTSKGRARAQIFGDSAARIADLEANLSSTRSQRKAALLPSAGGAAAGSQDAMYLDGAANARNQGTTQGLMDGAKLISLLFGKKSAGAAAPGPNDMFGNLGVTYQGGNPSWLNNTYNTGYTGR